MSHYDTLGVGADATPDEIKKGYRRAAARAHPDKDGGDTEQMAKVNRAYQVLSDPQTRAHYDQTGEDGAQDQGPDGPTALLMEVFSHAIDECDGDILAYCTKHLNDAKEQMDARERQAKKSIEKLTKKRDRLRRKAGGDNLFTSLIDAKLNEAQNEVDAAVRSRGLFDGALTLLKEYESTYVPEAEPKPNSTAQEILHRMMNEEIQRMHRGFFDGPNSSNRFRGGRY